MAGKVIQQPWHTTKMLLFPGLSMMMQLHIYLFIFLKNLFIAINA